LETVLRKILEPQKEYIYIEAVGNCIIRASFSALLTKYYKSTRMNGDGIYKVHR
jgi:hypothetical protein